MSGDRRPEPLILTALLDRAAQAHFDRLRREHFPAERNHIGAHVTLFHALPGAQLAAVDRVLWECAPSAPLPVRVDEVRLLGRGVAYRLRSDRLTALRAELAHRFDPWLTPQDRAKRDLHVTVQNKVTPERARALHAELSAGFAPWPVIAVGLGLWRYLGGPWEELTRYGFTEP